jgi:hypothetical protein
MLISGENFDGARRAPPARSITLSAAQGRQDARPRPGLSEDGAASILILEAGGDDTSETISDPNS